MGNSRGAGRQVARFAAAGVINTLIDYLVFVLLSWILRLPLERSWIAKAVSGALAMTNSFLLNRRWVFRSAPTAAGAGQLWRFLVVTLIGTFVVQLGGTHLLSAVWLAPGGLVFRLVTAVHLEGLLPRDFVFQTFAFGVATLASMTWNFLAYRRWVFPPAPLAATPRAADLPADLGTRGGAR
jgi:putative flippase GtrA